MSDDEAKRQREREQNQLLNVWNKMAELEQRFRDFIVEYRHDKEQTQDHIKQQGHVIDVLAGLVQGNKDINHVGLVSRFEELNTTVQKAEAERLRNQDKWKYILFGVSIAAPAGVETVVKLLSKLGILP